MWLPLENHCSRSYEAIFSCTSAGFESKDESARLRVGAIERQGSDAAVVSNINSGIEDTFESSCDFNERCA